MVDGLESWDCTEKSRAHELTSALKNVLGCHDSSSPGEKGRGDVLSCRVHSSMEGGREAMSCWGPFL